MSCLWASFLVLLTVRHPTRRELCTGLIVLYCNSTSVRTAEIYPFVETRDWCGHTTCSSHAASSGSIWMYSTTHSSTTVCGSPPPPPPHWRSLADETTVSCCTTSSVYISTACSPPDNCLTTDSPTDGVTRICSPFGSTWISSTMPGWICFASPDAARSTVARPPVDVTTCSSPAISITSPFTNT